MVFNSPKTPGPTGEILVGPMYFGVISALYNRIIQTILHLRRTSDGNRQQSDGLTHVTGRLIACQD